MTYKEKKMKRNPWIAIMSFALVLGAFLLVSQTGATEEVVKKEVFKIKIKSGRRGDGNHRD